VQTRYSRLNLIDLAGSERQKLSQTKGEQLKVRTHSPRTAANHLDLCSVFAHVGAATHRKRDTSINRLPSWAMSSAPLWKLQAASIDTCPTETASSPSCSR
jgi:hypothetical protein